MASATYRAPAQPGEDTVTVSGAGQKTALAIRLGGMKLLPEDKNLATLFADGKTKVGMVVIGGDPSFTPLAGTKVKLSLNEKELPVKGSLSAQSVTIGNDGRAQFTYSPPNIYGAKGNFRRGNVYITATASIGKTARLIEAVYRIPVYGGEVYYLNAEKVGFKSGSKIGVPAPSRNGILTGSVVCQAGGSDTFPVTSADLTLVNAKGKAVGRGASDNDGQFKMEFVGDPMSNTGQSMEMNEPVDAFKKFGADYAAKQGNEGLNSLLRKSFQGGVHKASQKILSQFGGNAMRGQMSAESPAGALAAAKEVFTTFEKQHNAQNMDHLDRELYRLDAKLFTDTVIKGPFVYLKLKKLFLDPEALASIAALDTAAIEKLQDDLIGSSDTVSKVFSAFDATFQAYQGYTWIADFYNAGGVKAKICGLLGQ